MARAPTRRVDASSAQRPRDADGDGGRASVAGTRGGARRADSAVRRHGRPIGLVRRLQLQSGSTSGHVSPSSRIARRRRSGSSDARGVTFSRLRGVDVRFEIGEPVQRRTVHPCGGDGRGRDRRSTTSRSGIGRLSILYNEFKSRDAAGGRRRPGAADPDAGRVGLGDRDGRNGGLPSSSRRRNASSRRRCCRITWRRRSSAPCSNRPRPSTRPA